MRSNIILAILFLVCHDLFAQQKGYYRTPAIYQNTVLFTAEGDLWKYDLGNGVSSRLTTDQGMEIFPVISPDSRQVVFSGQYEGTCSATSG
jgi:tricorn protease